MSRSSTKSSQATSLNGSVEVQQDAPSPGHEVHIDFTRWSSIKESIIGASLGKHPRSASEWEAAVHLGAPRCPLRRPPPSDDED